MICESTETTVGHHVKTKKTGGDDTIDNLIPLCHVHHREVHDEGLDYLSGYKPVFEWLNNNGWEVCPIRDKWIKLYKE